MILRASDKLNFIDEIHWNYKELNHYSDWYQWYHCLQGDFALSTVINDQPRVTRLYKKHNEVETGAQRWRKKNNYLAQKIKSTEKTVF